MKTFAIVATVATVLSTCTAFRLSGRANPDFPDPSVDPFYVTPANISSYSNGEIIRKRQIPPSFPGNFSAAYQVLIRTNDGQNRPTSTVSTIWEPLEPAWPPKILSYQVPEDADVLDCAPSWGWVANSSSMDIDSARLLEGPILVAWGMNNGWYVVNTDVEGPDAAWLVGRMEGRAGLDGIRAAISMFECPTHKTSITLFGYSGGAHASVWMSTLAQQYAPELNIVGAAFGGTPVDLGSAFELLNGGPDSDLAGGALFGLANGYASPGANPDLNATLNALLTPQGQQVAAMFRSDNYCIPNENSTSFNYLSIFTENILTNANATAVLAKESLLSNVSSVLPVPVPKFPRYEYHGLGDTIVPYGAEAVYVEQQCSNGANIQFTSFPGLNHNPAYFAGLIGALQFIEQSFAGQTPQVTCGQPSGVPPPQIGSDTAVQVLGQYLSDLLAEAVASLS